MEKDLVVTDKVNDDAAIRWQSEKIEVLQENNIELIIVPYLLVNLRIKINYSRSHPLEYKQTYAPGCREENTKVNFTLFGGDTVRPQSEGVGPDPGMGGGW